MAREPDRTRDDRTEMGWPQRETPVLPAGPTAPQPHRPVADDRSGLHHAHEREGARLGTKTTKHIETHAAASKSHTSLVGSLRITDGHTPATEGRCSVPKAHPRRPLMWPSVAPMPSSTTIRFTVGTDFGPRSGVWRIWSTNDEIYIAMRSIAGTMKTSLHSSGRYRHAFTGPGAAKNRPGGDRALVKWPEPGDFQEGAKLLFEIVVPTDELTMPATEPTPEEKAKIKLVEPAPADELTVISVIVTRPGLEVAEHPRPASGASGLIASWAMRSRGTLWVVLSHQPMDDGFRQFVKQAHDISAGIERPPGLIHPRFTLMLHDHDRQIGRYLDVAAWPAAHSHSHEPTKENIPHLDTDAMTVERR